MYYAPVVIPPHSIQTLTVRKGMLDLIVVAHKVDLINIIIFIDVYTINPACF